MNKKLIAIMAGAAILALAPLSLGKTSVTASASSNNTAQEVVEEVVEEETEEVADTAAEYQEYLDEVESEIAEAAAAAASTGSTVSYEITVNNDEGFSVPNSLMQALVTGNVDFTVHFTYEGVEYTVTIPAGEAIDDSTSWYGPLFLLQYYGSADVSTTAASSSVYTVKSGDTLGGIASANGMTVSALAALNPSITNVNLIYPGQTINLQ